MLWGMHELESWWKIQQSKKRRVGDGRNWWIQSARSLPAPKHALLSIILRDVQTALPIIADIVNRKDKRMEWRLKVRAIVRNELTRFLRWQLILLKDCSFFEASSNCNNFSGIDEESLMTDDRMPKIIYFFPVLFMLNIRFLKRTNIRFYITLQMHIL